MNELDDPLLSPPEPYTIDSPPAVIAAAATPATGAPELVEQVMAEEAEWARRLALESLVIPQVMPRDP
jgi:hypothetical protein